MATVDKFITPVLTSNEVKELTKGLWPDILVEDYLSRNNDLVTVADIVDEKNNTVKTVTRVTISGTPYTIKATDEEIFVDTDNGDITLLLPDGVTGTTYRVLNVGSSGNIVTLTPSGSQLLFGVNAPETIYDSEVFIITYESTEGWN